MKAKTIKSILRQKVDKWCDSIDDLHVRELAQQNTIVTGGAIVSMLLGDYPNDFDIYLRTREATYAVADYYIKKFVKNPPMKFKDDKNTCIPIFLANGYRNKINSYEFWKPEDEKGARLRIMVQSAGIATEEGCEAYEYFEQANPGNAGEFVENAVEIAQNAQADETKPPYRPVFLTSNAITLSDKVQIIVRFYGEADEIHENYDFVHCTNYWQSWNGFLKLQPEALECIINKELRYVGSKYPVCSIFRVRKFLDRGWKINAGQLLKACLQISQLDLLNAEVLEDQLIGVDAAYFNEVIALCQKRMAETGSDRVDQAYLIELIDRIF
jgi:hypothetical protein